MSIPYGRSEVVMNKFMEVPGQHTLEEGSLINASLQLSGAFTLNLEFNP